MRIEGANVEGPTAVFGAVVMWNVRGRRGSVRLRDGARFAGTILAPERRQISVGHDVVVDGALIGQRVLISNGSVVNHHPFSMIPLP